MIHRAILCNRNNYFFCTLIFFFLISSVAHVNATPLSLSDFFNVKVNFNAKGDGRTDDSKAIQNAVNAALAYGGGTIFFPAGSYRISSNLTLPSTINLQFVNGAVLLPDSGITLTVNSPVIAGLIQIFGGSGDFTGNPKNSEVYPEWFGAKADSETDNSNSFSRLCSYVNSLSVLPTVKFSQGIYKYKSGLEFTREVVLLGSKGSVLNYTGNGIAVKLGPDGLKSGRFDKVYEVRGLTFTGGENMVYGLYFNEWVMAPEVLDNRFLDFGGTNSIQVFFQYANWHINIRGNFNYIRKSTSAVWVWVNGISKSGVSDNGQSHLRLIDNISTNLSQEKGLGIYNSGAESIITNNKLEGYSPNIRLGAWAWGTNVSDNYFEVLGAAAKGNI